MTGPFDPAAMPVYVLERSGQRVEIRNEPQLSPWPRVQKLMASGWSLLPPEAVKPPEPPKPEKPKPKPKRTNRRSKARGRKVASTPKQTPKVAPEPSSRVLEPPEPPEPPAPRWAKVVEGERCRAPHRPPVWYAIPSADPAKAQWCLDQWSALGYRTAVLLDAGSDPVIADLVIYEDKWRGYPAAVKRLCDAIGDEAQIVVTGGDDIFPDVTQAPGAILSQFIDHFGGTLGVMQPTGDRWQEDAKGTCGAERVCLSPWMGREFIRRMNRGRGPFHPDYEHFYCDEEMHDVAERAGLLWHRPDLTQLHDHWSRETGGGPEKRPEYLNKAQAGWATAKRLFDNRKRKRFPGADLKRPKMKLTALTIARNEEWSLGFTARATLKWADELVVMNHNSQDRTGEIIEQVAAEHPGRVHILTTDEARWSEMEHRQATLDLARKHGATHCCTVDADEVLSANLLPVIRDWAFRLTPGQVLQLPWVCLWRGLGQYRDDGSVWAHSFISMGFADKTNIGWRPKDDGYEFHQRAPIGCYGEKLGLRPVGHLAGGGLLHLQFAQWDRLLAKQAWYKLTERQMWPKRDSNEVINTRYDKATDETGLRTTKTPSAWLRPYKDILPHLNMRMQPWQLAAMREMIDEHGAEFFDGLNTYGVLDE